MFSYSLDGLEIEGDAPADVEIEDNEITARAGVYHAFSRLFTVPDRDTYDAAVKGEWPGRLREAAALLPYDFDFGVSALSDSVSLDDCEAEFRRLFASGAGAPASIFSGDYTEGERSDRVEEIIRQFEYFGLKASGEQSRSPDHLATELEFMQYLAFKEAASSSPRLSASYHRAQEDFAERHLLAWLPQFAERVERANALPIYTWASQTLSAFVTADLKYISS